MAMTELQKKDELRLELRRLEDFLEALEMDKADSPRTVKLLNRRMEDIKKALED